MSPWRCIVLRNNFPTSESSWIKNHFVISLWTFSDCRKVHCPQLTMCFTCGVRVVYMWCTCGVRVETAEHWRCFLWFFAVEFVAWSRNLWAPHILYDARQGSILPRGCWRIWVNSGWSVNHSTPSRTWMVAANCSGSWRMCRSDQQSYGSDPTSNGWRTGGNGSYLWVVLAQFYFWMSVIRSDRVASRCVL